MLKSLTIYQISEQAPTNPENCQLAAEAEKSPIEISQTEKIYWASPYGHGNERMVMACNGTIMMCVIKEQKLIPTAILNQSVNEQLSLIRYQENREPSKKEKAVLREKIFCEMSVKAFVKKQKINIVIDPSNSKLLIATTQKALVDACLDLVYKTFPMLSLEQFNCNLPASTAMTSWLKQKAMPYPFTLLNDCEFRNTEENSVIKFKGVDLLSEDVLIHLNENTLVQKMLLVHDEKMQFTLNADGSISGIKYLEYVQTEKANIFTENLQAELEADFLVSADVISECLKSLVTALGGIVTAEEEMA